MAGKKLALSARYVLGERDKKPEEEIHGTSRCAYSNLQS